MISSALVRYPVTGILLARNKYRFWQHRMDALSTVDKLGDIQIHRYAH